MLREIRRSGVVEVPLKQLCAFLFAATASMPTNCLSGKMMQRVSYELHDDDRNICPTEESREEMLENGERIVVISAIR